MSTVSAVELAERVSRRGFRMGERFAVETLRYWKARGVAEETFPGRWRLTASGRAMFGGWAVGLDGDGAEARAHLARLVDMEAKPKGGRGKTAPESGTVSSRRNPKHQRLSEGRAIAETGSTTATARSSCSTEGSGPREP